MPTDRTEQLPPYPAPYNLSIRSAAGSAGPIRVETSERAEMIFSPIDTPPASEWPEFAWNPSDFADTIEVNDDLANVLAATNPSTPTLFVLHERCILELADIATLNPTLLASHNFTTRPDEFHQHALTFNSPRKFNGCGLQGFHITSPGSLGIRLTGTGSLNLRCNLISNCRQGIVTTGADCNMNITSRYNRYDNFKGSHAQAVYHTRGEFYSEEDVITQVGHNRGDARPSGAYLCHAFYINWEAKLNIINTFCADIDSHAAQLRGGGSIDGLLAVRTANGVLVGHDETNRDPVSGAIARYVCVNTEDIDPTNHKTGVGLWAERATVDIRHSIIADERSAGDGSVFRPQNDSTIRLGDGVRTRDISRLVDLDGHRARMSGIIRHQGYTTLVNRRKYEQSPGTYARYDASHISIAATAATRALVLPNFDTLPTPKPGHVGALIDSIINQ